MHALIGIFEMGTTQRDSQHRELEERIIPMVKHQPGFVAGYWSLDPTTSTSYSYIVFQTEAQANGLLEVVKGNTRHQKEHGVTLKSLTVVNVLGSATA